MNRRKAGASEASSLSSAQLQKILSAILSDPRYQQNIQYGKPRSGHPEGSVGAHIVELEQNLMLLKPRLRTEEDFWKLKLLIHVHDSFKAEAERDVPILHPRSHATLAREYASGYLQDADLLNMIQYHDANYAMWLQFSEENSYDVQRFQSLLDIIQDWDLFLIFVIIDGCTRGKDYAKLGWFIDEVRKYKQTVVDKAWILPPG